ncbi:MAG: sugar phosphate nucleotidyltransferase [Syntrophothermus sp.]
MKAMILAAGVGSRLEPLTCNVPKPMVPVVNRPAMEHIVALLKKHGYTDVIANLWYLPERIRGYFGDGSDFGLSLSYSQEKELLGTAGGLKKVEGFFDDTFLVISGDALTDIDLTDMLRFHRGSGALATIALRRVDDPTRFGVVLTTSDGRITGFQEKPKAAEALSNLANTGIYIFERELLNLIPPGAFYDFGKDLFPRLVAAGAPFYGYAMGGYWCDIGSITQYRLAQYDVLQGKVELEAFSRLQAASIRPGVFGGDDCRIDPSARLEGRILLGRGCTIGRGVWIVGETVIGDNCRIEDNAMIERSVIWQNTWVGKEARLTECVVGSECYLHPQARLGRGVILSDACVVEQRSEVRSNVLIWPGEVIQAGAIISHNLQGARG